MARLIKCKSCGCEITASGEVTLCDDCRKKAKRESVIKTRVCRICEKEFLGGPRAFYCPDCRDEQKKTRKSEYQARKRVGKVRELGSVDICPVCGDEYTVEGSRQMYCPKCADQATKKVVNAHKREFMAERIDQVQMRKKEAHSNRNVCLICGNTYTAKSAATTCSDDCAELLRKYWQTEADIKRGKRKSEYGTRLNNDNPKSGFTGITWHDKKWQVTLDSEYIGVADSVREALIIQQSAREKKKERNNE